jgi:hypothetical protein
LPARLADSCRASAADWINGVLTVKNDTSTVATLNFSGDYTSASFTLASDGHAGLAAFEPDVGLERFGGMSGLGEVRGAFLRRCIGRGTDRGGEEKKNFFSEEKKQKTFVFLDACWWGWRCRESEFFNFYARKNGLLVFVVVGCEAAHLTVCCFARGFWARESGFFRCR